MEDTAYKAIAIVGAGAVLPDAPNVAAFWDNVKNGRYSITEVSPDRWDPADYYDSDPAAPDKSYSKIGGWVRECEWEPMKWKLAIPPRVVDAMDGAQKWAIACTRQALDDFGFPRRELDLNRTAVILGNAMAGEKHYLTSLRIYFPEYAHELQQSASFAALPEPMRRDITRELHERMNKRLPGITEDSMPGELANCIAGRIANIFNFRGPNFVVDAACASAMAGINAAVEGLVANEFDIAITGGIDRNMGAPTFVKFCKIGALSATGSRPYADGADGFVMGEGAVILMLKRLADAERDGDKIYAVFRGVGASSDGKGKGITAPNPIGQKLAVERAWQSAGLSPATATMIEGHGTSTRVGDVVELQCIADVLSDFNVPAGSIALGSVKSNIGHLKGAAGGAGLLKTVLALRDKVLPPSLNCERLNPGIDFAHSPLYVNTELKPWMIPPDGVRRAGVSAFGFGGTNFHVVLEEHVPGRLNGNGKRSMAVTQTSPAPAKDSSMNTKNDSPAHQAQSLYKTPLRGALVIGDVSADALAERLRSVQKEAAAGIAPAPAAPAKSDLRALERIAIDYADAADLADKSAKALKAIAANQPAIWKALRAQGIFRGHGPAPKVAFLYTGQGSQYVNMMQSLRAAEPIVADTFAEADRVMTPLLGKPLSKYIFVNGANGNDVAKAEDDLRQTAITQPAVLATDIAMTRLLSAYGIEPDMTMGHSLGEYGALVASGALPFGDALEAVSARGREMTRVSMEDNGRMAAVFAPLDEIERIIQSIKGYVVIANINSKSQAVIGGSSTAVEQAIESFQKAGFTAVPLPVSHAFHTSIVSPASGPLRKTLERLSLRSPRIPIVANVNGEFYPTGPGAVPEMLDILSQQVAAPVQFLKGLHTLFAAGARVFVETGPKKALAGFVDDVLSDSPDVLSLFTNHPKLPDTMAFNQALCGLYASGLGRAVADARAEDAKFTTAPSEEGKSVAPAMNASSPSAAPLIEDRYAQLGQIFADVIERGWEIYHGESSVPRPVPVVISGAALGLPGTEHIFDDGNIERILRGDQFIEAVPMHLRQAMLNKHITRVVKRDAGGPTIEAIDKLADVIKLAARGRAFNLETEFGVSAERIAALDRVTRLAIAAGIDALRDAGLPLVMRYKTTTKGTKLPEGWGLPDALRDDTGVIFASAFPGYNSFADQLKRYYTDNARREHLAMLKDLRARTADANLVQELDRRIGERTTEIGKEPYVLDRRFMFRILSMGHSQFAELIGVRGPNTQINSACATTTQAVTLAEDWIRAGRCRRVIIIAADDVTGEDLMEWIGSSLLATGAAATDEAVEDAAIPFDRRRHGMLIGMGAAALVVESAESARERGLQPICELLSTVTANSAFHGTRLNVDHITQVMESLIAQAEAHHGISRHEIAPRTVFVSHETYTPARGGSAAAEIHALRQVFGDAADQIVIANTKGFTGHTMGTGIEDIVAVKALETGCVPPVANFKEVDPELGNLNLSKGGSYPVEYALRLGAGFGSQISMTLLRWMKFKNGVRRSPNQLGYEYRIADHAAWNAWLSGITGYPTADLEVVKRTLRVRDQGGAARPVEARAVTTPKVVEIVEPATKAHAAAVAVAVSMAAPPPPATALASPEPAPAAVPQVVSPVKPQPAASPESVKERVLSLVGEKTGYPTDMLDLDLDIEADLGVDTVKQAEVFASIREAYGIPRDDSIKLREFPTLAHVIRFVHDRRPDLFSKGEVMKESAAGPAFEVKQEVTAKAEAKAAAPTPAPLPEKAGADTSVQERILALVVEKTGYPQDMLDLDLDLEADLGVDTVKQAELFAAIRGIYDIPRDENLKLRDFPTLKHVIQFVYDKRPDLKGVVAAASAVDSVPTEAKAETIPTTVTTAVAARTISDDDIKEKVLDIVAEKTGYPKDMLDLDLDLEADLGVDTVKQAEMFAAVRGAYNIPRDENLKLRDFPTLAHVIKFAHDRLSPLATSVEGTGQTSPVPQKAAPLVGAKPITDDEIKEKVLDIVAEKTGYPKDMLDLDLDLEADLGVDTVKQAEMFAAVRGAYNIPRDENLKLRDFPTLAHVIKFAHDRLSPLATSVEGTGLASSVPSQAELAPTQAKPAPVAIEPPPTAPPVEASAFSDDEIKEKVLDIVAEKTGYPKDMLDLDLDLEADLGVDTVKQAEMFAAVRGAYNIPRDENLKLRDFPTLAHVIKFAHDRISRAAAPSISAGPAVEPETEPARDQSGGPVLVPRPNLASFEAADRIPRRVTVPVLRPPITICKSTGVTLGSSSRVIIMPDQSGVADELAHQLELKGTQILRIDAGWNADKLAASIKSWLDVGPVQGVYWLAALDHEGRLEDMNLAGWHEALRLRLKSLYAVMRILYEQIAGPGTFLVSATRLGGHHGYDEAGAVAPMGGAVVGFTKTYKRERADALVKAVDFEAERKPIEIAEALIAETLKDPGAVEIGYKSDLRWTIGLTEQSAADGQQGLKLDEKTVFLVTGAAGSIVSAITADLAAASGGTFYLLDLVPKPDPDNSDIKRFLADKDGLKRDLFARIQARGERATPALVEKELAALERAHAALSAIEAVQNAGGTAHYFSVDLTDTNAVAKVIEDVRRQSGHIDVLLHAAGMERSHFLPDKDPREFNLVFDVKSDGWFNLLHAIGNMPLGATVAFSSIAGRFGNGGQTDYSSANDLLCKYTSSFRATRPSTRGIVIDWSAWGGIGMATRGSIPKMMEVAGIDMLPPEAGIPLIRRELTTGGTRGEVLIGQRLGILLNEWDVTGGIDTALFESLESTEAARGPMIGKIVAMGINSGLIIETMLDPKVQPFLHDHQIDGTPVLPGVMGIEAFGEIAQCVIPGWRLDNIEQVNFLAPFKFYRNEPRTVTIEAVFHPQGDAIVADCRLIGRRQLPNQPEPQTTIHFTARVRLTKRVPDAVTAPALSKPAGPVIAANDIYRVYFHGPAYRVVERAWHDGKRIIGQMPAALPLNHEPAKLPTVVAPRLLELCFQTAGLLELAEQGRMGLPQVVDQVIVLRAPENAEGPLYAVVSPSANEQAFNAQVTDSSGNVYVQVTGYRTIALPNAIDADSLKALKAAA
jgi:acyl transferase domain-containing protein/NAD(P)-dependent dehydrogenase (short-subunit alcohol dehydrogenase family)